MQQKSNTLLVAGDVIVNHQIFGCYSIHHATLNTNV
jgi:hypothetical protein